MSTQAQTLVSHLHRLKSSPNARLPPLSCPLEPKRPHLHHVHSSSNARHLPPPCLFERKCLSPTSTGLNACHLLPPCLFERKCSSPTSTVSIRARTLVIHLNHFHSSAIARFLFFYRRHIFFSVFWIVFEAQFVWVNLSTYMLILLI